MIRYTLSELSIQNTGRWYLDLWLTLFTFPESRQYIIQACLSYPANIVFWNIIEASKYMCNKRYPESRLQHVTFTPTRHRQRHRFTQSLSPFRPLCAFLSVHSFSTSILLPNTRCRENARQHPVPSFASCMFLTADHRKARDQFSQAICTRRFLHKLVLILHPYCI